MIRHKNILFFSIGIGLTVLYLLCSLHYSPFMYTGGDFSEYLNAAYRVLNGEVPYRDFWLMFPPLEVYFPAFIIQLSGTANLFLYQEVLIRLLNATLIFLMLRESKIEVYSALILASILLFIGGTYFYISLCLCSALFLIRFMKTHKQTYLLLAIWFIVVGFGFRCYQMLPFVLAAIIWFFLHTRKQAHASQILYYAASIFLLPLLIYYAFLPEPIKALQAVMIDAVHHGTSFSIPYLKELRNGLNECYSYYERFIAGQHGYTLPGLCFLCLNALRTLIIYLLPIIVLVYYIFRYNSKSDSYMLFVLWGVFFLPYALHFSNLDHLETAFTPFLILILAAAGQWLTYHPSKMTAVSAIWSVYILLQSFHVYRSHSGPAYNIQSRYFSFTNTQSTYVKTVNHLVERINSHIGEVWVCTWSLPPLYLMTERKNPCYYDSPIDFILNPGVNKEERMISCLNGNDVSLIILEIKNITHLSPEHTWEKSAPQLSIYIRQHYKLSETIDRYAIFIKE